ncbi:MAG TPA: hypothetical protein VID26_09625 [Candidatus Limnocylindrales bacterium]|jgi:hypothetical protein
MPDFDVARRTAADEIAPRLEPAARIEAGPQPALDGRCLGRPRPAFSPRQVIALQRSAGNRAVRGIVRPVAQRVAIKDPKMTETLYNTERGSTGKATAKKFEMDPAYEMTRTGDTGAAVTVRIQFLNQTRDSQGAYSDKAKEIPASDERRAWAKGVAEDAAKIWNGRLTLVGEGTNPVTKATVKKRLPLTFNSVAVFGLNEPYHNRVIVYPKKIVAGSPGQPIDAGNWYMNKGTSYDGDDKLIAAHEYGHLIGIPDEYSQSNEQLNALIHQAAPANAPSAMAAIDRITVERMVFASLAQRLVRQLDATMPTISRAFRAQRTLVKQKMATAAAAAVSSAVIVNELQSQLTGASTTGMAANVSDVVARDTTTRFNEVLQAGKGVEAGFSARALAHEIRIGYISALRTLRGGNVAVAGLGNVSIGIATSVRKSGIGQGATAQAAGRFAKSEVGPPGLPKAVPDSSLAGQISALPGTWAAAGSLLETGVTPEAFATAMLGILKSAAAASATPPPPGAHARPKLATTRALEDRALRMVSNAASGAARQVAADLIDASIAPIMTVSTADLGARMSAEVNRVMTTPPAGIPALGPADPNMAAVAASMKATLDKEKAATAGTGRDPLGAGNKKKVADQDVTYDYQGLMGSTPKDSPDEKALRPDQFNPIVAHFNHDLLASGETPFTAEVK